MTLTLVVLVVLVLAQQVMLVVATNRHEAQITELLSRLQMNTRVTITPGQQPEQTPTDERSYISDFTYDDKSWNDYVGIAPEDEEE